MRYHNNNKVIPTYYATFTLACIVGAAIVYREFEVMTPRTLKSMIFPEFCRSTIPPYIVDHQIFTHKEHPKP